MQAWYEERFEREMGLDASDFRRCLPGAFEPHPLTWVQDGRDSARIELDSGAAQLHWQAMPPRVIALLRMPRVHVHFDFRGVDEAERQRVMQHFDLVMLRGGG